MVSEVRDSLKYTDTHEWIKIQGETAIIGITDHAQSQLTDVVFVELPKIGKEILKDDELCVVESVKSVSEIIAPISGKIANVNTHLEETPETINESPYDEGWLVEIEIADESEIKDLLDAETYKKMI